MVRASCYSGSQGIVISNTHEKRVIIDTPRVCVPSCQHVVLHLVINIVNNVVHP